VISAIVLHPRAGLLSVLEETLHASRQPLRHRVFSRFSCGGTCTEPHQLQPRFAGLPPKRVGRARAPTASSQDEAKSHLMQPPDRPTVPPSGQHLAPSALAWRNFLRSAAVFRSARPALDADGCRGSSPLMSFPQICFTPFL
jgi:hypothetical protein